MGEVQKSFEDFYRTIDSCIDWVKNWLLKHSHTNTEQNGELISCYTLDYSPFKNFKIEQCWSQEGIWNDIGCPDEQMHNWNKNRICGIKTYCQSRDVFVWIISRAATMFTCGNRLEITQQNLDCVVLPLLRTAVT